MNYASFIINFFVRIKCKQTESLVILGFEKYN